ncbi:MAG TPA: peptide chain release factor N(5)-glutamine methyltransferase [Thermoanaerobaculia bacterium]|nr:peptide chain release factor N(5)-glutamine methyltransferase [Thermoanaerobaculia bacterium]
MTPIRAIRAHYREEALRRRVNPRDVDLLLADVLRQPITSILAHDEKEIAAGALESFRRQIERRFEGEPLQYIRGKTEFFGRDFIVDDRVLIPRPETELLVEAALELAPRGARLLDVGTGTGCVAISLAKERADLSVVGSDRSMAALAVARRNRITLDATLHLVAADLAHGFRGRFDLVVSNPPYIPEHELASLQTEVRDHEPRGALSPGADPLAIIERLLIETIEILDSGASLLFEIGYGQQAAVTERAEKHGWNVTGVHRDLAGIPRVVVAGR